MALLPGGTLVVAETWGNRLTAFDVGHDGVLGGRRVWASFGNPPGTDDVAEATGRISVAPDGVYACMLGGDDGRTLFVCVAPSFAEHERRDAREARLLSHRVGVPRAGLP